MDEYLTPQETADVLKLSVHTLATWRSRNPDGPPFIEIGGAIRYPKAALVSWLESRRKSGGA